MHKGRRDGRLVVITTPQVTEPRRFTAPPLRPRPRYARGIWKRMGLPYCRGGYACQNISSRPLMVLKQEWKVKATTTCMTKRSPLSHAFIMLIYKEILQNSCLVDLTMNTARRRAVPLFLYVQHLKIL